jgi:hypothetical protein
MVPVVIQSHYGEKGAVISARTQLGCCFALNKFWFFAGFTSKPMADFRSLEYSGQIWNHVNKKVVNSKLKERYAHSMTSYMNRYIMIYGGASQYFSATKRRETLDDLWVYDTLNT